LPGQVPRRGQQLPHRIAGQRVEAALAVPLDPDQLSLTQRQGLGAISGSAGAVFALLGVAALFVLIVTMIARGLQLILGAIGTLFAGLAVFVLLNFPALGPVSRAPSSRPSGTS
jgi:hypothetical protein